MTNFDKPYVPSPEEEKKAEKSMTFKQKELSKLRERHFEVTPTALIEKEQLFAEHHKKVAETEYDKHYGNPKREVILVEGESDDRKFFKKYFVEAERGLYDHQKLFNNHIKPILKEMGIEDEGWEAKFDEYPRHSIGTPGSDGLFWFKRQLASGETEYLRFANHYSSEPNVMLNRKLLEYFKGEERKYEAQEKYV